MMEEQNSKRIRRRRNNTDSDSDSDSVVVDRISGLPECILGDILSFLPTREAIATSLLSKRWKFSWLGIHNLDFEFIHFSINLSPDDDENVAFIRFVSRALLLIDGRRPLNMFSLVWETHGILSHVICWIDAAILRNVIEINLSLDDPNLQNDLFEFPISGFNCDSLRSLQLCAIAFVYDTTVVCLPRLETLILDVARFTSEEAFEKLVNGCPMLQHLELRVYPNYCDDAEEDFMYLLSSPSLRHLDIYTELGCTLKLDAPSLEYLKLHGPISEIFVEKSLISLNQAFFNIVDEHLHALTLDEYGFPYDSICQVVCALDHAKFLTLSAHVMRGFTFTTKSSRFRRLVKLEVSITSNCWSSLRDLIRRSNSLKSLTIYKVSLDDETEIDHSNWTTTALKVPRCLKTSLKDVYYDDYNGLEDEREMIRYMLKYGSVLEDMHIRISRDRRSDGEKLKLVQEICEYPRKSPVCKVRFSM